MSKKELYPFQINYGWRDYMLLLTTIVLSIFYVNYFYALSSSFGMLPTTIIISSIIGLACIIVLNFCFFPVFHHLFFSILKKPRYDLILSKKGIQIANKYLQWRQVKSISFSTGRPKSKIAFYRVKFALPAKQTIFVLDKQGREYKRMVDIDYFSKHDRSNNNLVGIEKVLADLKKANLISDWAER
ncbi:hypothetical protein JW930_01250 [Candidatus Woesearchaeota archaeon]|nr:hypothetical protein [Candidatus Woesearchaeota archaeon]